MEFVDYYAILRLPRDATPKDVRKAFLTCLEKNLPQGDAYDLVIQAYKTLRNRYRRARYDRHFGHLLVIQPEPEFYPNAQVYQLPSIKPHLSLQHITDTFKQWVMRKYDIDWQEAENAHFSYHIKNTAQNPQLILRFPQAEDRELFLHKLLATRIVREPLSL